MKTHSVAENFRLRCKQRYFLETFRLFFFVGKLIPRKVVFSLLQLKVLIAFQVKNFLYHKIYLSLGISFGVQSLDFGFGFHYGQWGKY